MPHKFQPGDVVKLKSGGPKMTVGEYSQMGQVGCQWFVGPETKQEVQHARFDEDQLELCGPEPPKRPTGPRQIRMGTSSGR